MGGHKQGGQRGHHGGALRNRSRRNCHPDDRVQVSRALDVPGDDLRRAGDRLEANRLRRDAAAREVRELRQAKREAKASSSSAVGKRRVGGSAKGDPQALAAMALQAAKSAAAHAARESGAAGDSTAIGQGGMTLSMRKYGKAFKSVVEQSDVLVQVLDARDPLGCRLHEFELAIHSQYGDKKKLIMVLNKADMVPDPEAIDAWVEYFAAQDIPAVPFSARPTGKRASAYSTCSAEVYRVLRRLARVDGTGSARKSLMVGVIGYPNVGKSSTINALKGKDVVGAGNTPGFTTGVTEVDLRGDVTILDSPGVIVQGSDGADVVLRNAAKLSDLQDPLVVVERLLMRVPAVEALCAVYGVPVPSAASANPVADFLRAVALTRGRLRHGGKLELSDAARMVLKDWNDGRIVHFTHPPEQQQFGTTDMMNVEDAPELLTTLAPSAPTLPTIIVAPPVGAEAATWTMPESRKFTGKIKYNPLDTSSDDDDDDGGTAAAWVGGAAPAAAQDDDDEAA